MIQFLVVQHSIRDYPIVEVRVDGKFVATICPDENNHGMRVISNHLKETPVVASAGAMHVVDMRFE
jgi:hypothetical protein